MLHDSFWFSDSYDIIKDFKLKVDKEVWVLFPVVENTNFDSAKNSQLLCILFFAQSSS